MKRRQETLKRFCAALGKYERYLLTCHVAPEGDAIGSMLAMESLLRRMGKKTVVANQDPFPERLPCLSKRKWKRTSEVKRRPGWFDAVVLTDCANLNRIGDVLRLIPPGIPVFNIDHHISNENFGTYNYVRPTASATGEVVYDLFSHMKMKVTREEAKNLYVAIATDTGSFKYSTTTAHSHHIAAHLIETGIDIEKINDQLHSSYSLEKIQLYSRLFGRIRTSARGRVAWVEMRRDDLRKCGATYEDTEGFIDFLRYMKEVHIVFFMTELKKGTVKVSFRSRGNHDVNRLATLFGGGGHKKAAACVLSGPLKSAEQAVLAAIKREFKV